MLKSNGNYRNRTVTAVIQARMQSSRLPEKAILPLGGKPLIYHVIERTHLIEGISNVVLATGNGPENDTLASIAQSMGCNTFRGSETNVLERFYLAAREYNSEYIIRVTGDNPFMDPGYASKTVSLAIETDSDVCAIGNLPLGIAVEIIKFSSLEEAYQKSSEPYHFEHVTPFLKEKPEIYKIIKQNVEYNNPFQNLRLTVDAPDDYKLAKILYEELYGDQLFYLEDIITFLEKKPHYATLNSEIRQRKMTEANN